MNTFDQLQQCHATTLAAFRASVMSLRSVFCSEVPTESGRLMLVRDGESGPLVGYREDYIGTTTFYLR